MGLYSANPDLMADCDGDDDDNADAPKPLDQAKDILEPPTLLQISQEQISPSVRIPLTSSEATLHDTTEVASEYADTPKIPSFSESSYDNSTQSFHVPTSHGSYGV